MASQDIPLVGPIINKIFGTRNERVVKRFLLRVDAINALGAQMSALSDAALRAKTAEFRQRFKSGESGIDLLPEAFAVAREAMDRNVGIRNIFNPKFRERFEKNKLSPALASLYDRTLAAMDAAEPAPPVGDFQGCTEPQPGWVWMDIPIELYDAVRDMYPQSKPPFRARPFDVQLIGGMVLYQGRIAEMKTGEGKTIVAPLACYLAAIEGWKIHVVTVNDYLVQRDRDWTFPFFRALGLTVGAIHPMHLQPEDQKRAMYQCDVVYGTTAEFGFDYLRDNMKRSVDAQVQRYREFAIVDEVDSILIDEARTPLIISGQAHEDQPRYDLADKLARHLVKMNKPWDEADAKVEECKKRIKGTEGDIRNARDKSAVPALQEKLAAAKAELPRLEAERDRFIRYYETNRERKQVHLTHQGIVEAQKQADIGSFYVGENIDMPHLLEQALRAHAVYERDVDYVVMPTPDPNTGRTEPDVVIVDVNTGRPMVGRQWSDGLHQAIQAKEGLRVRPENQTVATITIQNFFKMYKRLAGMTGTADTEAQEFHDIYKLDVVVIPTNVPVIRRDFDDTVYLTAKDKWQAIVDEIKAMHDVGRPVLVGTTSVEKSEMLSRMLASKHNIKHEVLNAKQHEREAHIIENAGQLGAVMIATNMAGRGTDIKLGRCSRTDLLNHWARRGLVGMEIKEDAGDDQLREHIFRRIAPKELGLKPREVEQMSRDELELALLRHWAQQHTFADPKKIASMSADALREALDQQGRFLLHRVRWVSSIEELGGLHVIGTERHESRRIDNQLRGRSGRQGDRGSSRFFVALDDDLMKMFAGETTMKILARLGMKEGDAIEHPMLSKSIGGAQRKVEERNFQIRKNILEYDEVMEYQRQDFYGMRQRVLEGRDLRGLIFSFVEQAAIDAVNRFLDKDFRAESVAQFASEKLGCSIPAERLRGRESDDLVETIRRDALDDARHEVNVTIGEYIPPGADLVDIDTKGLIAWAANRFKVDLNVSDISSAKVREISDRLLEAAEAQIRNADLSGIEKFLVPDYGAGELSRWLKFTMDLDVKPEEFKARETNEQIVEFVLEKVRALYKKREIEYPVEFAMDLTMAMMRTAPEQAANHLVHWANTRFNLGWTPESLRTRMPPQIREELLAASAKFVESNRLQVAVDEALACRDNEALEKHLREKYQVGVPNWMKRLRDEDRDNAIRAVIESILRAELVQFERFVLLDVLDTAWKEHLYAMDQLRDTIGFRSFSQQDPRIEYKREGSRLYREMLERLRDRVAEYVFKLRLRPQFAPPPGARPPGVPAMPPPPGARRPAAVAPVPFGGGTIMGPGLGVPIPGQRPAQGTRTPPPEPPKPAT